MQMLQVCKWVGGVSLAMIVAAAPAMAIKDPETGQSFADQTSCGGGKAHAVGVGVREATLGVDVYAVVVYADNSFKGKSVRWSHGCAKIVARFVRNVGKEKVYNAWIKSFKKNGLSDSDANVKKFLGVISSDAKDKREMSVMTHGSKVVFKWMGKSVTITGARKLAKAVKNTYLGPGSPTPELVKDVKKRGIVKP